MEVEIGGYKQYILKVESRGLMLYWDRNRGLCVKFLSMKNRLEHNESLPLPVLLQTKLTSGEHCEWHAHLPANLHQKTGLSAFQYKSLLGSNSNRQVVCQNI